MIFIVLVILVAAIILNAYLSRKNAIRRENEHERQKERFERLMNLLQKPDSEKSDDAGRNRDNATREDNKS